MKTHTLQQILWIGAGGFVGSILRVALGTAVQRSSWVGSFPAGTLVVNILGCFLIGLLGGLADTRPVLADTVRPFLVLGLLGAFTTFSTFGNETFFLARDVALWKGVMNVALQVGGGLAAVALGVSIVRY